MTTFKVYAELIGSRPWVEVEVQASGEEEALAKFREMDEHGDLEWNYPESDEELTVLEAVEVSDE